MNVMKSPPFRGLNHHDVCSFHCGTNLCRNADSGAVNTVAAMMRGEVREWMELDRFTVRKVATEVAAGDAVASPTASCSGISNSLW